MKKILLSALLASAMSIGALAEVNVTVTPLGDHPGNDPKRVVSTADVLVNEDFSAWENGTEQEPEFGEMMGTYENPNIDPFYMHGQQWQGYKCYQAGGTCALRTFDPMGSAYVETPKGDWSGSVHISFLAKYLKVEWEDENGEKWHWSGSGIKVGLSSDSDCCFITTESYDQENGDTFVKLADVRLYDNQGWCQVDIDFDNYSAFNDAYLTFYSGDGVLLDDIKITTTADNFIASPVVTEITDVTETSFKVKFEPVRKAYNYYGYLYEFLGYNEETGDQELSITISEVNGQPNGDKAATTAIPLRVYPFLSVNRPLVEEYTGLWCGYCPRGYVALETMKELYPDRFVGIAYHSGDDMGSGVEFPTYPDGFPAGFINRNYVLVTDRLSDPSWKQANYYAPEEGAEPQDNSDMPGDWGYLFTHGTNPMTGLEFNDMALTSSDTEGMPGSIPAAITAGEEYSHVYTFDIASLSGETTALINQHPDLMRVVGIIIDRKTGRAVNCVSSLNLNGESGVAEAGVEQAEVVETMYYDLQGRPVARPERGIYIKADILSDGTCRTSTYIR